MGFHLYYTLFTFFRQKVTEECMLCTRVYLKNVLENLMKTFLEIFSFRFFFYEIDGN